MFISEFLFARMTACGKVDELVLTKEKNDAIKMSNEGLEYNSHETIVFKMDEMGTFLKLMTLQPKKK